MPKRRQRPEAAIQQTDLPLRDLLTYDPATGVFRWATTTRNGKRRPGDVAGSQNSQGYVQISVAYKRLKAHRLAWFFVYGRWPASDLDHVNRDRADNRIRNLREATRSQNCGNSKRRSRNTSGFKGVSLHRKTQKWRAMLGSKYLGLFDTPELAHAAYCSAAQDKFGEFWRSA